MDKRPGKDEMDTTTQTDTQGSVTQTSQSVDTPSNQSFVTSGSTSLDQILGDLGVTQDNSAAQNQSQAQNQDGQQATATQQQAQTQDDSADLLNGDPNLILQRNDYLRRMNAIAAREAELNQREQQLNARNGNQTQQQDGSQQQQQTTQPSLLKVNAPDYEFSDESDKILAGDIAALAKSTQEKDAQMRQMFQAMQQMSEQVYAVAQERQEKATSEMARQLEGTVSQLKEKYGIEITMEQAALSVQNVGKAILNGRTQIYDDFVMDCWMADPHNRAAYEAAVRNGAASTSQQQQAQQQQTEFQVQPLRTGGGRSTATTGNMTEEQRILADLEAAGKAS